MAPIHKRALGAYTNIHHNHITMAKDIILCIYIYTKNQIKRQNNAFLKLIKINLGKSLSKKVCL